MIRTAARAALALAAFVPAQALACGMYMPDEANLIAMMGEIDTAERGSVGHGSVEILFAEIAVVEPAPVVPAEQDLYLAAIQGELSDVVADVEPIEPIEASEFPAEPM